MKKFSALLLALVMTMSVNVFAETGTIGSTVNVDGTVFTQGQAYTAREVHTFTQAFTVNGQTFAAGTQWDAVLVNGTWVPVGSAAVAGAVGVGLAASTIGYGLAALGVVAVASSGNGGTTTVTQ